MASYEKKMRDQTFCENKPQLFQIEEKIVAQKVRSASVCPLLIPPIDYAPLPTLFRPVLQKISVKAKILSMIKMIKMIKKCCAGT